MAWVDETCYSCGHVLPGRNTGCVHCSGTGRKRIYKDDATAAPGGTVDGIMLVLAIVVFWVVVGLLV